MAFDRQDIWMYLRRIIVVFGLLAVPVGLYAMRQTPAGGSSGAALAQEAPPAVVGRVAFVEGNLAIPLRPGGPSGRTLKARRKCA
jgi:hypothetical protein